MQQLRSREKLSADCGCTGRCELAANYGANLHGAQLVHRETRTDSTARLQNQQCIEVYTC